MDEIISASNLHLMLNSYNGTIEHERFFEDNGIKDFNLYKRRKRMKKINTFTGDIIAFAVLVIGLVGTIAVA